MPTQEQVDAFLPPFEPRQVLDPDEPVSIGAMVGPEAFTEVRYLAHAKQMRALELIPELAAEFRRRLRPRARAGCVRSYRTEDAETDRRRARLGARHDQGHGRRAARRRASGSASSASRCFRPFPLDAVRARARRARSASSCSRRALAVGLGGHRRRRTCALALSGAAASRCTRSIAGLGGRPITKRLAARAVRRRVARPLEPLTFLDLDRGARRARARAQARGAAPARTPRTSCATSAIVAAGSSERR